MNDILVSLLSVAVVLMAAVIALGAIYIRNTSKDDWTVAPAQPKSPEDVARFQ